MSVLPERLRPIRDKSGLVAPEMDLSGIFAAPLTTIVSQRRTHMASRPTEEFRAEAVRVASTSGLPRKQVAADFGIVF